MPAKRRLTPLQTAQLAAARASRTFNKENQPEPLERPKKIKKLARTTILRQELKNKDKKLANLEENLNMTLHNIEQLEATTRQKDKLVASLEAKLDAVVVEKSTENMPLHRN